MSIVTFSTILRHTLYLPKELWVSCLHTSSPSLSRAGRSYGKAINKFNSAPTSPSRRALVKDLRPKNKGRGSGQYEVAPGRTAPHQQERKFQPRRAGAEVDRPAPQKDRKFQPRRAGVDDHFPASRTARSSSNRDLSVRSNREGRYQKSSIDSQPLPPSLRLNGQDTAPKRANASFGSPASYEQDSEGPVSRKPKIVNPLSEEFQISTRSEPIRNLPVEFTAPPLLEGLLTSLTDVLGPHAKPTPIQALSLKYLLGPSSSSTSTTSAAQWKQYLLASETGSGKSIAYLLPLLQHLKLAELNGSESSPTRNALVEGQPRRALNPRALVLAPTHELTRQLSGFAKALLHIIKLRVLCVSQANTPSTSRRSLTASKMSELFDSDLSESQAISAEFAVRKKAIPRSVDVLVGTPSKVLEMVRGRGWDREQQNVEDGWGQSESARKPRQRRVTVGEPEVGLANVEWVVVDEADVLFDPDFQESTRMLLADISAARGHPVSFQPDSVLSNKEFKDSDAPTPLDYPFNLVLTTATIPSSLASYLDTYHPQLTRLASPNLHRLPSTLKTEYCSWSSGNRNADIEQRIRRVWYEDGAMGSGEVSKILIFCNKSTRVEDLGKYLKEKGIANVALASNSEARNRGNNHHLDGFLRDRRLRDDLAGGAVARKDVGVHPHVVITTSLLSRGLDFSPSIKHVFIVDEPRNMIDFLHRAGRSGRAGERGKVVVFGKTKGRGSSRAKVVRKKVGALIA